MTGEFVPQERDSFIDEQKPHTGSMSGDCLYLGGMVRMVPDGCSCRIGGFGEPYCIMMRRLPCPKDCPDRKARG
jgi:hypothetical protein